MIRRSRVHAAAPSHETAEPKAAPSVLSMTWSDIAFDDRRTKLIVEYLWVASTEGGRTVNSIMRNSSQVIIECLEVRTVH